MQQKTVTDASKDSGKIISFFSGVGLLQGLPRVFLHEVLNQEDGQPAAIVVGFDSQFVEALFFDEFFDLKKPLFPSRQIFSIPVSDKYIGRIVDGLGNPIDGLGEIRGENVSVFSPSPQIIQRQPVSNPLVTGIKIIDSNLPLGRGQRQLIIGDRKIGKSTLVTDIVLNQKKVNPPLFCFYVICGQKEDKYKQLAFLLEKSNAFLYTSVIVASAQASYASKYLAPFVGCTIAEHFRNQGMDALVIYDDLTKHASTYRDISLLLKRPPGRESYPGDIFSLHAMLLERAAKLSEEEKGGSLTALPIIETQEGDITSYISSNLISITDGQMYLERRLFQKGFIPAINIGLSVSRIGVKAQPQIFSQLVGGIRLILSQHKELQKLSQLETSVSENAQKQMHRGDLMLELLKQDKHSFIDWPNQALLFYIVSAGFFDDIAVDKWQDFENLLLELLKNRYQKIIESIRQGVFNKETEDKIREIILDFKHEFLFEKEK